MIWRVILPVLLGTNSVAIGYRAGAPRIDSVCLHRLPHHDVTSQTSESPYVIRTSVTKADGSYDVTVNITSITESAIRGFAVQLLPEVDKNALVDNRKPVGRFETNADVKVLSCLSIGDTATHQNNLDKEYVVLRGNVLAGDIHRKIYAGATVLQRFDIFWTDVTSDIILEPDYTAYQNPSAEWLDLVTNVAKSYEAGHAQWEENIKTRLKLGYYKMVDDWGHLKTKYIGEQLPFKDHFRKSKIGFTNSHTATNMSSKEIVDNFLLGDFTLSETVGDLLETESIWSR